MAHVACESMPEHAVAAAKRGAASTRVRADAEVDEVDKVDEVDEVVTLVVEEQAGLQLLAQFWSIHAEDAPVHCP